MPKFCPARLDLLPICSRRRSRPQVPCLSRGGRGAVLFWDFEKRLSNDSAYASLLLILQHLPITLTNILHAGATRRPTPPSRALSTTSRGEIAAYSEITGRKRGDEAGSGGGKAAGTGGRRGRRPFRPQALPRHSSRCAPRRAVSGRAGHSPRRGIARSRRL